MHAPLKVFPWCLVLLTASSSEGRRPRSETIPISTTGWQSTDTCPSDIEARLSAPPTDVVRIGEDGRFPGAPYVSILVDGQRVAWYAPESTPLPPLEVDIDTNDIESVEVVKPDSARRAYGPCPGVGLILITTKRKTWRPNQHHEPRSSASDKGKAIVPPTDDSLMAILDAYWEKRVTAAAAAKVIADYLLGTGKPLNIQMDAELRDAVTREMKARQK